MQPEMKDWGKDHWSTLAYLETLCVNGNGGVGIPDKNKMRCDPARHPGLVGPINNMLGIYDSGATYPTRLKNGEINDHDDWDIVDDFERYDLIKVMGTGINPAYLLTKKGAIVAHELRTHKVKGGKFHDFMPVTKCKSLSRLQMLEDSKTNVNLVLGRATVEDLNKARGYVRKDSPDITA